MAHVWSHCVSRPCVKGDEFSYALGARGSTRKKLAAAAGCIMEYIGQVAVIAGMKRERRQGRDYLEWLLKQRTGKALIAV